MRTKHCEQWVWASIRPGMTMAPSPPSVLPASQCRAISGRAADGDDFAADGCNRTIRR